MAGVIPYKLIQFKFIPNKMGNCCATTPGQEIIIQQDTLHANSRINRNQMAEADFGTEKDIDMNAVDQQLIEETASRL